MSLDFSLQEIRLVDIFSFNITHNLAKMAKEAGLYYYLWGAIDNGFVKASELVPHLETGLQKLLAQPSHYKQFNPKNGWGTYENLVEFVENLLAMCKEHPEANIHVSR